MTETVDQKKCPFCAELIKVEAKICRFCQKEIVSAGDSDKVNKNIEEWKDDDVSLSDHPITCPHCSYEGKMAYDGEKIFFLFRFDYWIYFSLILSFLYFLLFLNEIGPGSSFLTSLFIFFPCLGLAFCVFLFRWIFIGQKFIWSCPNCDEECTTVTPSSFWD